MKISPVPSTTNAVSSGAEGGSSVQTLRALTMKTNATPGPRQAPPVESKPELEVPQSNPTVEATQPISPQFAALARERRAIQRERQAFLQEKAEAAKSQGSDPAIPTSRLKNETLKVLQEAGITYDHLTEAILGDRGNPELLALQAKIDAIEQGVDKRFADRETREEQQLYSSVEQDAKNEIAANADDYELIQKMGRLPIAIEVWKREFKETNQFPDISGILKDVEEHCLQECQEFTKLKKIQALFPQTPAPQPQPRTVGMRTLTNKDTASVPMSRIARALAAANGTLKR